MWAQPNMQRDSSILVKIAGSTLKFPWAGGLNFTNWGLIDLDADGFRDLVVYDKSGYKVRTFINDAIAGQASFTHNSTYQNKFPFLNSWFTTYDYNRDGLADVFTYSSGCGGIQAYKNLGNLQFAVQGYYSPSCSNYYLSSTYSSGSFNIPDNGIGIPGLTDMDGDGDMDIIVFDVTGSNVEYHENQSWDLYHNYDSLVFTMSDNCWGKFYEGMCSVQLDVCPYPKTHRSSERKTASDRTMHAGSGLVCFDADGDSLIDILEGDISCDSLYYMSNKGIRTDAHMVSFSTHYPPSKPVDISIFPCPFFLDVNNDNKRDLVVAPGWTGSEDVNNQWLYLNAGTDNAPNFNYVRNNFLQQDMIDLGEGAFPTLFDYEGDGDLDMLVGNFGYYGSPTYTSSIAFFKNIGTTTVPSFSLITTDFANLSTLGSLNMAPTTGDLDGDGDADLLIGDNTGRFSYFTNTGGAGNPVVFSSTPTSDFGNGFLYQMDVGLKAYPQIIDLDRDGKLDVIAGNQAGKIYYYRNTGSVTTPSLTLTSSALGGVNVLQPACSSFGNAMPYVFDDGGSYKMLVGSECGNLFLYHNIDGNLGGTFAQINATAFGIIEGEHTAPVVRDLNGDGRLDLLIGNYSGGLDFYKGLSSTYYNVTEHLFDADLNVFPDPASDVVTITIQSQINLPKQLQLIDITGRKIKEANLLSDQAELDLKDISNGIYFIRIVMIDENGGSKNAVTKKIVVQHE